MGRAAAEDAARPGPVSEPGASAWPGATGPAAAGGPRAATGPMKSRPLGTVRSSSASRRSLRVACLRDAGADRLAANREIRDILRLLSRTGLRYDQSGGRGRADRAPGASPGSVGALACRLGPTGRF